MTADMMENKEFEATFDWKKWVSENPKFLSWDGLTAEMNLCSPFAEAAEKWGFDRAINEATQSFLSAAADLAKNPPPGMPKIEYLITERALVTIQQLTKERDAAKAEVKELEKQRSAFTELVDRSARADLKLIETLRKERDALKTELKDVTDELIRNDNRGIDR